MEGEYYLNSYSVDNRKFLNTSFPKLQLGEIADVFNPPVFKRRYGDSSGNTIAYFQSSDVDLVEPVSSGWISKEQAEQLNLIVKRDWMLMTGFGIIGSLRIVDEHLEDSVFANNVCRIIYKSCDIPKGYLYAFLACRYGQSQIILNTSGSVVKYIEAPGIKKTLIPLLDDSTMIEVDRIINCVVEKRAKSLSIIKNSREEILRLLNLEPLDNNDFEAYSNSRIDTDVSAFIVNSNKIKLTTINAFNYSKKIDMLRQRVCSRGATKLENVLTPQGVFKTSSFKRLELKNNRSKMLLGQRDVFTINKVGKLIAKAYIPIDEMIEEGEVIIAAVGTMGESEVFCRTEYAGRELEGKYIVGEFIRMKTSPEWHPGYLYAWLSTEYGFRFLRSIQSGTKLCRPIPELLMDIPVPELSKELRDNIGKKVKEAYELRYEALQLEKEAISLIEKEIG